jgi:hypothetical protein
MAGVGGVIATPAVDVVMVNISQANEVVRPAELSSVAVDVVPVRPLIVKLPDFNAGVPVVVVISPVMNCDCPNLAAADIFDLGNWLRRSMPAMDHLCGKNHRTAAASMPRMIEANLSDETGSSRIVTNHLAA